LCLLRDGAALHQALQYLVTDFRPHQQTRTFTQGTGHGVIQLGFRDGRTVDGHQSRFSGRF
tara:strand:- start:79344 stop:79526 length:183 start_codon:yes stop_codon:yes gene_type:complete